MSGLLKCPTIIVGFPHGSAGKESACNVGDLGLITRLGRSPGEGKAYPLQYSGLENAMDCIVHEVTKSWTWLTNFHFHYYCVTVNFISPFILVSVFLTYWGPPMLGIYIYIIAISSSCIDTLIIMYYPSLSFIISLFQSLLCLIWVLLLLLSFGLHLHEISFSSTHFQSVCVPRFEMGLL